MQNKPDDKEVLARRELLECAHDPCAYDHFCSNHRLLADLERELAGAHEWLAKWRRIAGEASETIGRLREEASSARGEADARHALKDLIWACLLSAEGDFYKCSACGNTGPLHTMWGDLTGHTELCAVAVALKKSQYVGEKK